MGSTRTRRTGHQERRLVGSPSPVPPWCVPLIGLVGACGDALLPSDYAGTPAGSVPGDVVAGDDSPKDADRPHLTLEWLTDLGSRQRGLVGQSVTFERSTKLTSDWDIGLGTPAERVKLSLPVESIGSSAAELRVAIAKLVYFDDRVPDGSLDWACVGNTCDQVKSVSDEFVVYLDRPLDCAGGGGGGDKLSRSAVSAGYHYFSAANGSLRELPAGSSLHFTVVDRTPADSDPTEALRVFAAQLRRTLGLALIDRCL